MKISIIWIVGLAIAATLLIQGWRAYERHDAATDALNKRDADQAETDSKAIERIDDATTPRSADDARERLRNRQSIQ